MSERFSFFRETVIVLFLVLQVFIPVRISDAEQAGQEEGKQSQIEKIESDLQREKRQLEKFDIKEKDLLGQLSDIEKKIFEKQELLKTLKERIRSIHKDLEKRRQQLILLESVSSEIKERLSKRLVVFYKYAKRGYMKILATSSDLDQLQRRTKYLQIIMNEDQRLLREMLETEEKHKHQVLKIQEQLAVVNRLEKAEQERLASIKEDQQKRVILLMKIHKEKEFYETAVKELQIAANHLKTTLLDLDRKPPRKKQPLPSGFKYQKGRLPLPTRGFIFRHDNPLGAKNTKTHKGIYIEGPEGAAVSAVYSGRVDYSGWLKGYGQIIILNHGGRHFSVSAHLAKRMVVEGDTIKAGDVIGLMGQTESFGGPGLYFELRKGGKNLDPLKWLKVH